MPAPEAIFRPVVSSEAVATLVLIENSQPMTHLWSDLRDHHLPTLLGTMRLANPIVPIQVLWLITSPVNDNGPPPARSDKELPNIRIDPNPSNKISPAIVERGINLLAETFENVPAARHLILVPASSPSEASAGATGRIGSEWPHVAQKLQEERIYLHVILNPAQSMSSYRDLFYGALKRQGHQEILPWFPADLMKYQFLLAGTPCVQMPDIPNHPPLLRNNTYPPDSISSPNESSSSASAAQEDAAMPCLVTRLQKMHGLTRKRIYASQSARQPFVREERVRDKYFQVPAPLFIPSSSSHIINSPSADTRIPLKSKTDRVRRLSAKSPLTISPPETGASSGTRSPWLRRNSRSTLPTGSSSGSYPSSPTSVSSYSAHSPELPTPRDFDSLVGGTVHSMSAPWEPSWLCDQTEQYSSASTINADAPPFNPVYDQGGNSFSCSGYSLQPLPFPSVTAQEGSASTIATSLISRSKEHSELPAVSDDGDKPFIICPEYEAAATARFKAIFGTSAGKPLADLTPMNTTPDSGSVYNSNGYYTPPSARPPPKVPLANFCYVQDPQYTASHSVIPQFFSATTQNSTESISQPSTGSSSLEGWDGR